MVKNCYGRILIAGGDQGLLHSRKLILGTYFQVEAVSRAIEARALLAQSQFDVVILCSTLSGEDCDQIDWDVEEVGNRPKLIFIGRPGRMDSATHAISVPADIGLFDLLKTAAYALGLQFGPKGFSRLVSTADAELLASTR